MLIHKSASGFGLAMLNGIGDGNMLVPSVDAARMRDIGGEIHTGFFDHQIYHAPKDGIAG